MRSILKEIKLSSVLLLLLGSAILAFGLYNIHSMSNVTEGGILGLTLLLEYWFGISPSVSGFVLTILCYILGWKLLGKRFLYILLFLLLDFLFFIESLNSLIHYFQTLAKNHFWQQLWERCL